MPSKNHVSGAVLGAVALLAFTAQPVAAAVELLSHRAVYQLSLAQRPAPDAGRPLR